MTSTERDDLDALAGEYVLGTLDRDASRRVEQRLAGDAALRSAVERWQDRLLPLATGVPPMGTAPSQWPAIERELETRRPPARATPSSSWWDSVAFWRWASAAAAACVLVLGILTLLPRDRSDAAFVAVLAAPDRSAGWLVHAVPGRPLDLVPLIDVAADPARSLQFWTLLDKAQGPVSLGLVTPGKPLQVPARLLPGLAAGQLFEITSEPYGGSPVGRPTGAILWKGLAVRSR